MRHLSPPSCLLPHARYNRPMLDASSTRQARTALAAVIPDLEQRSEPYRVLSSPPDPEFVEALIEQARIALPALRAAVAAGDFSGAARHAHSFKGMGGAVGLPEVSAWGEVLERVAKAGQADAADRLIAALEAWVRAVGGAA
jgi:HPt (histidine-containing phosphotransfer) domain-containing protein